jgi:hypothetical protein
VGAGIQDDADIEAYQNTLPGKIAPYAEYLTGAKALRDAGEFGVKEGIKRLRRHGRHGSANGGRKPRIDAEPKRLEAGRSTRDVDEKPGAEKADQVSRKDEIGADGARYGRKKDGTPRAKPGPKPKGEGPHNNKVEQIIAREKNKGKEHIGGGSEKTELTVETPGGAKPTRRMDASFRDPETGEISHYNVGKFNKRGDPIKRERDAESDVKSYAPKKDRNITVEEYDPEQ